ncbi:MAG: KH domain-containing protein [Candidatus Eremiobacteraeota bacterium]|nr:KH domain-containing protein [Candidatus Eremiobacteraeota bacterium]MBC5803664.1 KH domain-containing protein [Candidatus Eremiobacteraeota bacterium]MBC5822326.1 KH domain-containing protein [Candidatus Eremiobacteraeota bacterium]
MSAFDDEFGLFGEEAPSEEDERRSTLGARTIATGETVIDEIEPEDERPARRRGRAGLPERTADEGEGGGRWPRRRTLAKRDPLPPEIGHPRAVELLTFLAKKLVSNPDAVVVELHPDARGAVLELEVDPEDIGKVIGRGGRVAQALRTLVRAGAEGRVTIDIVDAEEDEDDEFEEDDAGDQIPGDAVIEGEEAEDVRLEGPLRSESEPADYQEP